MLMTCGALLLLISIAIPPDNQCDCTVVDEEVTTHSDHDRIVLAQRFVMRTVTGQVGDTADSPMTGVLIEVFDHPEVVFGGPPVAGEQRPKQNRIAACQTQASGQFCFPKLEAGNYELRLSKVGFRAMS